MAKIVPVPKNLRKNLAGMRVGQWEVLGFAGMKGSISLWLCKCHCCGRERAVVGANLLRETTKSCGKRDGRKKHPLHETWAGMIVRCRNPKDTAFHRYGGRGITVCERWTNDFWAFVSDMGPKPDPSYSIERIDNDGNYEPGNCVWASPKQQTRNTTRTNIIEFKGKRLCLTDWAKLLGIPRSTLSWRFHTLKEPVEVALREFTEVVP